MLNTPALVVDLDAMERNIERMADFCRKAGVGLRPHAKMHKCSQLAKRQLQAGAIGICCATLDEAEVMAAAGVTGLLLTSPVVSRDKIERLLALCRAAPDAMIVVDHPRNAAALAEAAKGGGLRLSVLVDLDLGHHRTGVTDLESAIALAREILALPSLKLCGLQAYGGHFQHIHGYEERIAAAKSAESFVGKVAQHLRGAGVERPIVTGAGTGTHLWDGTRGVFTELQAGSYVFMDAEYNAVEYRPEVKWPFEVALFVETTVISVNVPGFATVDAGTKAFALNGPLPQVVGDHLAGATYAFAGDEHGRIRLREGHDPLEIGEKIRCIVPHCDPTVALYDDYYCMRDGKLEHVWKIDARGRRASASATLA